MDTKTLDHLEQHLEEAKLAIGRYDLAEALVNIDLALNIVKREIKK